MKLHILILALFLTSCATYQEQLSPEDRAYLARVNSAPSSFSIAAEEVQLAHDRAEAFASKFSANGLSLVTDIVIESHRPSKDRAGFGYRITFMPSGDGAFVEVRCFHGLGTARGRWRAHNEKILAHYLKTGEIKADFVM